MAYNRSSAPKNCRVYGWHRGYNTDIAIETGKIFLLAEFSYDLEKSNAQTFNVLERLTNDDDGPPPHRRIPINGSRQCRHGHSRNSNFEGGLVGKKQRKCTRSVKAMNRKD